MYQSIICSSICNTFFSFSVLYSSYIFLLPRLSILFSFLKAFCLLLPLIFRSLLNLIACYCPFLHLDLTSMSVTVSREGFLQKPPPKTPPNPKTNKRTPIAPPPPNLCGTHGTTAFLKLCVLKNLYSSCFYRICR